MIEKVCLGCGLPLQDVDAQKAGYVESLDQDTCRSCYRIQHYGDFSMMHPFENYDASLLEYIASHNHLFLWVVDLFHLNESLPSGLIRALAHKSVILVGTKRDLYPQAISDQRLYRGFQAQLGAHKIQFEGVSFLGSYSNDGLFELKTRISQLRRGRDVSVVGAVNVGKSTLINALSDTPHLTDSPIPATTLRPIEVETSVGVLYDTPGFIGRTSLLEALSADQVKALQAKKTIKPLVYQLKDDQALLIGGLGCLCLYGCVKASVVLMLPPAVSVERVKIENVERHQAAVAQHAKITLQDADWIAKSWPAGDKVDYVIEDVGYITIFGTFTKVETRIAKAVNVLRRKAI